MTGRHWQHRLLGFTACGADPAPQGTEPAAQPAQISCAGCAAAVKTALRQARERNFLTASTDDALLLQQGQAESDRLWKHRYGPVEPETEQVRAAYFQANLRADEALDTALYVLGMEPPAAQIYARQAYRDYLQDYASNPEY